jgi:hypothetical protein
MMFDPTTASADLLKVALLPTTKSKVCANSAYKAMLDV